MRRDFSLGNYSCDDVAGDVELTRFDIEWDKRYSIPWIKLAAAVRGGRTSFSFRRGAHRDGCRPLVQANINPFHQAVPDPMR